MPTEYQVTTEHKGALTTQCGSDPFPKLIKTDGNAKVTISVGRSLAYGELKVSASVTVTCDQQELVIDKAGELAFTKAVELVDDCFREAAK